MLLEWKNKYQWLHQHVLMLVRGMGFEDAIFDVTVYLQALQLMIYWMDDKVCANVQRVRRGDREAERESDKNVLLTCVCLFSTHALVCPVSGLVMRWSHHIWPLGNTVFSTLKALFVWTMCSSQQKSFLYGYMDMFHWCLIPLRE